MDRAGIIVSSLAVVAVALAVTGSLTHAQGAMQTHVMNAEVDLSRASQLVLQAGSLDIFVSNEALRAGEHPGASIHAVVRGNHAAEYTIEVRRHGDAAVVVFHDPGRNDGRGVTTQESLATVVLRGPVPVIATTGSGDVTVTSAARTVFAHTGSGTVRVVAPRGDVQAGTGSGDTEVTVGPGFAGREIAASTGSGDVSIHVPDGFRGTVRTHTSSGSVSDEAHIVPAASPVLDLRTGSGDIGIDHARDLGVTIRAR